MSKCHYTPEYVSGHGWIFYMPAEHGPDPFHQRNWAGDIVVGPFNNEDDAYECARSTRIRCIVFRENKVKRALSQR